MKKFAWNIAVLVLLAAAYLTGVAPLLSIANVLMCFMSGVALLVSPLAVAVVFAWKRAGHPNLQGVVDAERHIFKRSAASGWVNCVMMLVIVIAAAGLGLTYTAAFFGFVMFLIAIPCVAICRVMIESAAARGEEAAP